MNDELEIECDFTYEAAHQLPKVPEGHKCGRMHGHSYHLTVTIAGPLDPETGWIVDFATVRDAVQSVITKLDHQTLNDIPGLENPTCEIQVQWLYKQLIGGSALTAEGIAHGLLRGSATPVRITSLELSETARSRVKYTPGAGAMPAPWRFTSE